MDRGVAASSGAVRGMDRGVLCIQTHFLSASATLSPTLPVACPHTHRRSQSTQALRRFACSGQVAGAAHKSKKSRDSIQGRSIIRKSRETLRDTEVYVAQPDGMSCRTCAHA
eukprot:4985202-Pleurochrysis_carterae.AAC.1